MLCENSGRIKGEVIPGIVLYTILYRKSRKGFSGSMALSKDLKEMRE